MTNTYKIQFMDMEGTRYDLYIYPSETGIDYDDYIELNGGTTPFATDEEDSTDLTKLLRYSTGTLTFIDTIGGVINDIMPTTPDEVRVTLKCVVPDAPVDTVVWEGYIQQQAYSQNWDDVPLEVSVPVISRLGMICSQNLSFEHEGMTTVAELLQEVCGDVYPLVYLPENELSEHSDYGITGITSETPVDLQVAFHKELFKEEVAIEDLDMYQGNYEPKTYEDVLTNICTLFGWTMYEEGNSLICRDIHTCGTYRKYAVSSLGDDTAYTEESFSALDEADITFASVSHTEGIVTPAQEVNASANNDAFSDELFSLDNAERLVVAGLGVKHAHSGLSCISPLNTDEFTQTQFKNQNEVDISTAHTSLIIQNAQSASDKYGGGEITSYSKGNTRDEAEANSWLSVVLAQVNTVTPSPAITFKTKCQHLMPLAEYITGARRGGASRTFQAAFLHISGEVTYGEDRTDYAIDSSLSDDDEDEREIRVCIKIGDYYLSYSNNQYIVSGNLDTIDLPIKKGKLDSYINIVGAHAYYDEQIEVTLYTPVSSLTVDDWYYLRINDFKISIEADELWMDQLFQGSISKSIAYHKLLNTFGSDSADLQLDFGDIGTKGMLFTNQTMTTSTSTLYNAPLIQLGSLVDNGSGIAPLVERIFNRFSTLLSVPRHTITMDVRNSINILQPIRIDSRRYVVCGRSRDYRDGSTSVTIINIES